MRRTGRGAIDPLEAAFLQLQISGSDAPSKKNALQRLCRLYRLGQRLRSPEPITLLVLGLLYEPDEKVVRWALNASAFLVKGAQISAVLDAIARNRHDPDILGAGVAALAATHDEDRLREVLEARGMPLQGATLLAAAQKIPKLAGKLASNRVDIDRASIPELRLAGVLVGIDRAPERMFEAEHDNCEVIGSLNLHPDDIVAQYSIWATMENQNLGLSHLRISLADVMAQRPNVRAYIYRLVAADVGTARANLDFLDAASQEEDVEARQSLARGLRDTYFDGLEELVVSWILEEEDSGVRRYLLEHMAVQTVRMARYADFVEQAYRYEPRGSTTRARLELAAKGTALATTLGRIRILGEPDFLRLGGDNVTNTFNFNGPATGAFSGSGSAATGDISFMYQLQAPKMASEELEKLYSLLAADETIDVSLKEEVKKASNAPTKGLVEQILSGMKVAKEAAKMASATLGAAPGIMESLHKLLPYLPG